VALAGHAVDVTHLGGGCDLHEVSRFKFRVSRFT